MRIVKIAWENYRRLPDGEIHVRNHMVLVGPNDSGKSSVLRAVHMCLGMTRAQLLSAVNLRDFTDSTKPLRLEVELYDLESDDLAAFPDEVIVGVSNTIKIAVEADLNLDDSASDDDAEESKEVRRFFIDAGHSRGPSRAQFDAIGWAYVAAARSLVRELAGAGGTMQELLSNLDLGSDSTVIERAAGQLREAVQGAAAISAFGAELATTLSDALPNPVNTDQVRISTAADLVGSPLAGMTVAIQDGDHLAPLAEQSDGVRALSVLALLAMSQRAARIVGVDEPETHLHTSAQRAVARSFRKGNGQRLVVSHSAALVGQMDPQDIVAFGADRRPRQLPSDAFATGGAQAAKYWIPSIIDSLTARRLLFVEGPSDRIICETVADLIGLSLDRVGVAVIELGGGSSFGPAYRVLGPKGFNLPIYGITDEDKRDEWAKVIGSTPEALEAGGILVCNPDLEAMYVKALGRDKLLDQLVKSPDFHADAIMAACGVQSLDHVSEEGLVSFCGHKKRKVQAAAAITAGLTLSDAESMTELCAYLRWVAS
ncbi:ATP-dependent nuclease [Streptomyces zaomyceticus]|uniref:ATP-dependent nuclease n=1 Tax=Streptomyces zaomyceticus TaxID=68286 RepID=UPI0037A74426